MKTLSLSRVLTVATVATFLIACGNENEIVLDPNDAPLPDVVDFNYDVKPILSDTCYLCHGPDKSNAKAGLSLSSFNDATSHITDNGLAAIVAGDSDESEAFLRMISDDENYIMPPLNSNLTLSNRDKAILKKWIDQGAEYKKHWALISPEKTKIDESAKAVQGSDKIDQFITNKLATSPLKANEQADKETLLRRVSFDLTGLPPTTQMVDAYLADNSVDAFEKQVDNLIANPAFGERMAVEWLDVARYADTHGYSTDYYRDMSPYRDWVINSFNQNRPFDQFVTWQIAGDLLPNATQEQILATAFNRVHAQNGEGGIVDEEFRVEYVKDRVQTIGTGLLGLTMHCAQCHDHKYDPISADDYYSTFAFFNNIDDSGQISYDPNDMPVPTLLLPNAKQQQATESLSQQIAQLSETLRKDNATDRKFLNWLSDTNNEKAIGQLDAEADLIAHFPFEQRDNVEVIKNAVNKAESGKVLFGSELNKKEGPELVHVQDEGRRAIKLNGDDALYFPYSKGFDRARPFTINLEAKIPTDIEQGVLFHYNKAAVLYNFKGFDVGIEDNHWQLRFAHTYPYNAIVLKSKQPVTRDVWQSIALTYDGSSKAAGAQLYIDGKLVEMTIERDNLYKDIEHTREGVLKEIGIKIGARWRSRGLPNALVDNLRIYDRQLTEIEIANIQEAPITPSKQQLLAQFNRTVNKEYLSQLTTLRHTRKKLNDLSESISEIMVMQELPEQRQAYILDRGGYANHGTPVSPGVPEAIMAWNNEWPNDRRGLAQWLTSPRNPLVARVVINRYWQLVFGDGLVRTPEDFGNQGKLPTHPVLLDWLAREFIDSGWDVKHMIKLMVTSTTYQQSSIASAEEMEIDPENKLWARGPSSRLTAEMIRDNALSVSNLLIDKIGGESVKPYQPDGIWKMNNMTYERGTGEELYRRSMYTIYKRSAPPPNMMAFDAPSRSYSVGVRQETSTPLQALALLNDPQIIEASKVLAEQLIGQFNEPKQQLEQAYRMITGRHVPSGELDIIIQMYEASLNEYNAKPQQVTQLLNVGERNIVKDGETEALAALTSVTNMLMNHDAAVIKR